MARDLVVVEQVQTRPGFRSRHGFWSGVLPTVNFAAVAQAEVADHDSAS
ncbi:MAG: hypothetical protein BIP78_0824 [Candidatus Bipolaricaulis sibiricus]|uniref:Uncharacterized protein n=1 Tax=Bipolaricaulis sibiricus TaxID=2501609 RepID=A0A410FUL5_BIPS1|nr:MAG: hypothetical protein BIP78_0824 [Candidatus Bipolaricaulis sibiricus]